MEYYKGFVGWTKEMNGLSAEFERNIDTLSAEARAATLEEVTETEILIKSAFDKILSEATKEGQGHWSGHDVSILKQAQQELEEFQAPRLDSVA